jgi:protein SCO1/2
MSENKHIRLTLAILAIVMIILVSAFVHRLLRPAIMTKAQMETYGAIIFDKPRMFRDFALVDQSGQPFLPEKLKGKWTLLFFGYTFCPDVCPTTMGVLNHFYTDLGNKDQGGDVQIVLVSVDPARDTVEKLRDYTNYFNAGFVGVTGEFMSLHAFATDLNAAFVRVPVSSEGDGSGYLVEHSGNIVLVNPYGHYHGFFKPPFESIRLQAVFTSVRNQFARDFGDAQE